MSSGTRQLLVEMAEKLDEAIKSLPPAPGDRPNLQRQAEKAQCWDLLMAMCGHTQNGSDRRVTLHQDDATHTRHISVDNYGEANRKDYWGGSFEAAIRSAAAAGECTE